jgi:glycine/D-amino acid oxidase-like deaminating enzyme
MPMDSQEHFDILIIGAGISGMDAAYHLQTAFPRKTYSILEAREAIGGTWDLFRYPGVRSDSDMHTLGFSFRPWHADEAIADGPAIWNYIRETATHYGIDRHIRLGQRMMRASWSFNQSRAFARFSFRLCPPCRWRAAQAGTENAVESAPELFEDLASFTFASVSDGTMNFFRTSEAYNGSRASPGSRSDLMIFSTTRRGGSIVCLLGGIYAVC